MNRILKHTPFFLALFFGAIAINAQDRLDRIEQQLERAILYPTGAWPETSLTVREWYLSHTVDGSIPTKDFIDAMREAYLLDGYVTLGDVTEWILKHNPESYSKPGPAESQEAPDPEENIPDPHTPSRARSVGNFLFKWDTNLHKRTSTAPLLSTMILLSPALGLEEKKAMIDDYVAQGNSRIHLYFLNDDNYSAQRGGPMWAGVRWHPVFLKGAAALPGNFDRMPGDWYARTAAEQLGDWRYWIHYIRNSGLKITAWMHPNDAKDTFNNQSAWPEAEWASYNRYLIREICNWKWNGTEPAVDEIVVKLEADDEWSQRDSRHLHVRKNVDLLNRRTARLRQIMNEEGCTQTLWYHNEADNSAAYGKVWDKFDWSHVDGVRIQKTMTGRISVAEVQAEADIHVAQVPPGKLFYWSEYAGGDGYEHAWIGTALADHYKNNPRFMGIDNGGKLP